jgi:hypothetical protein
MSDNGGSPAQKPEEGPVEHLNIKVTDNNNEVFFKIKRTTALRKLMGAFCDRQGKNLASVRFLFDGQRVQPDDSPDTVCKRSVISALSLSRLRAWCPAGITRMLTGAPCSSTCKTETHWRSTRSRSEAASCPAPQHNCRHSAIFCACRSLDDNMFPSAT